MFTRIGTDRRRHDPAELVASVVKARGATLLRVHRRRLRREDLEDCLSQAALELVLQARQGMPFRNTVHLTRALEQRFLSRVHDRRRALTGRSTAQATFEQALAEGLFSGDDSQVADPLSEVDRVVEGRFELARLRALMGELTADQQLVLTCQVDLQMGCEAFCARFGWTPEKYRKVAQRARARLRTLTESEIETNARRVQAWRRPVRTSEVG